MIDQRPAAQTGLAYFDRYERQLDHTIRRRFITMRGALQAVSEQATSAPVIVEVGTLRDDTVGGGHSTFKFGEFCERNGGLLHSVDVSTEAISFSQHGAADYLPWIQHHVIDSVAFLDAFDGRIDLLYLDGLDSTAGQESIASQKQLEEITAALPNLSPSCVVLLDDADLPGEGKTLHSSRFLAANGFKLVEDRYQRLFVRSDVAPAGPVPRWGTRELIGRVARRGLARTPRLRTWLASVRRRVRER